MTTVGFIGAGRMGEPMVERMLDAGHSVSVYVRRPEVRERLTARGAVVVDDPAAAAAGAEVFLSCLFDDKQLAEVGPSIIDALPGGAVFASHTTGSVALLRQLLDRGRRRGVEVVDAPVSGTAEAIRAGKLLVLLGGETAAVQRCAAVVAAYAEPVQPTGELGSALAVKLVNNLLFAANMQLLAEGASLAGELGVAQDVLYAALAHASGGSHAAVYASEHGDIQTFGARISEFLGKDVAACQAAADELGVRPDLLFEVVRRGPLPLTPSPIGS